MNETLDRVPTSSSEAVAAAKHRARLRRRAFRILMHLLLIFGAILMVVPLAWTFSTSLKRLGTEFVYPPEWIPNPIAWDNYLKFSQELPVPFYHYIYNTLVITVAATFGTVLTSSLAGFAFARLRFKGRDGLFILVLSTMMLPYVVTLVPTFLIFRTLGWLNSNLPLIVPYYFGGTAFSIFLLRQFFLTLPMDLDEAARIDGASNWQIYLRIALPLARPALAAVVIFQILSHWNDFLGPLIYINSLPKYTIALALRTFQNTRSQRVSYLMAGATLQVLPVIVLFFAAQRQFIRGIHLTGLAGR